MAARPPARHTVRRRVSRRRYMLRRAVALLLAMAVVFGFVRFAGAVLGTSGQHIAASAPTSESPAPTDARNTVANVAATQPASEPTEPTVAPTTTELQPKPISTPTQDNPAVLYIAGDSDAGTFGPYLQKLMNETGVVKTVLDYKVSSGLARPDFFDWPAHFAAQIPEVNPDIVVVTFGGNDGQGLTNQAGKFVDGRPTGDAAKDAGWRTEYGTRVGAVMDYLSGLNRTLVWVGIPNNVDPNVTARMQVQDEVVKAEAAKRPDVVVIDTWARFSGRNGGYGEYVIDPRDGIGKDVRAKDGFHLNETGAEILALDIAQAIRTILASRGATL